jgi:hypothetical protein
MMPLRRLAVLSLLSASCGPNAAESDKVDATTATGLDASGAGHLDAATTNGGADSGTANPGADASVAVGQDAALAAGLDASTTSKPDGGGVPPGHTDVKGGVPHTPGGNDPLTNCVACHGADLKGGTSGQSCYACHNSNDHLVKRGSCFHKSGQRSTCVACHGPGNSGGLGPACH